MYFEMKLEWHICINLDLNFIYEISVVTLVGQHWGGLSRTVAARELIKII